MALPALLSRRLDGLQLLEAARLTNACEVQHSCGRGNLFVRTVE